MAKTAHIHKFKRHRYKTGNEIFFCTLPDCSIKLALALALGKRTICWRCGESFVMTEYSIRLAKPHCDACHMPKSSKGAVDTIEQEIIEHIEKQSKMTLADRLTQTIQEATNEAIKEEDI